MAGGKRKLSDMYSILPNVLVAYHPLMGVSTDANVLFEITDYFWAGTTYSTVRSGDLQINNLVFPAGTNISSRLKFGYAYQTSIGTNNNLIRLYTHEVNLHIALDNLFKTKAE